MVGPRKKNHRQKLEIYNLWDLIPRGEHDINGDTILVRAFLGGPRRKSQTGKKVWPR